MDKTVVWILWAVGAYLVGSIPFGFLVGKMRGKDIRTLGSKNIGATNVYRTVGKPWGILAFACDFLKGFRIRRNIPSHPSNCRETLNRLNQTGLKFCYQVRGGIP